MVEVIEPIEVAVEVRPEAGPATEPAGSDPGAELHDAPVMETAEPAPAPPPSCEGPGGVEITAGGHAAPPTEYPAMDAAESLVAALEVFLAETPVPETACPDIPDVPPEAPSEIRPEPELSPSRPEATEELARQIADLRARLEDHVSGAERAQAGLDATIRRIEDAMAATVKAGEVLVTEAAKK